MGSQTSSDASILEFLEKLRRERDELNILISGLERRLGITQPSSDATATQSSGPKVKVSIDDVPVGFFHNLSQPLAAEKLLRLNPGQPLSSQEMLDAFRKSGMVLNPKNASTILYTALSRNPKFERVAGKAWGLAEWYPESKRKQDTKRHEAEQSETRPEHE